MSLKNYPKKLEAAYFSMEMMLETDIPTYAGGLGVLAGDLLRSCADMNVPAVGITLVYSGSTFSQVINPDGTQTFNETKWQKPDQLTKIPNTINLEINDTNIVVGCWRYDIVGADGFVIPVYLLDTDLPENPQWVQDITKGLYSSDGETRFNQELVLGIGGIKMLRDLGYKDVKNYHMNEGHTSFASLALLSELDYNEEEVRKRCVFTTHTPVPEGHDHFDYGLAHKYGENYMPLNIKELGGKENLNMTLLGINLSNYSFGVSKKHKKVTQSMFPDKNIDSITNGVHHRTWISPEKQCLYNEYLSGWYENPKELEKADDIPNDHLWNAHRESKRNLITYVNKNLTSINTLDEKNNPPEDHLFDLETLTISLARRPVAYKRPLLLYHNLERLVRMGVGKIQIIQCGKSHPDDDVSQGFVKEIIRISKKFKSILKVAYLEDYSPRIARLLVSGSDVWLNTPRRPLEASGTSGMKAAMNGVLNFSVLDGWWIEGYEMVPQSGFPIGPSYDGIEPNNNDDEDANSLYETLENEILPLYYENRKDWIYRMKKAITLGAYFNTHRCIEEYKKKAWK